MACQFLVLANLDSVRMHAICRAAECGATAAAVSLGQLKARWVIRRYMTIPELATARRDGFGIAFVALRMGWLCC